MSEGDVPAQTRGFLFSDLRGYSAFVERHGDRAARELLSRYRGVVREVIGRFGGAEIRTEGDSFYVVFDSVSQTVEAALAIQAGLAADAGAHPIRAGIGIHAGEVEDDAEHGIVSAAVNIAARICAVAEPGEVLVSDTVRALTRSYLSVAFLPRGRPRLKGIADPIQLYRVSGLDPGAGATPRPPRGAGRRSLAGPVLASLILAVGMAAMAADSLVRDPSVADDPDGSDAASLSATPPVSEPLPSLPAGSSEPAGLDDHQRANLAYISPSRRDACLPAMPEDGPRFRDVQGLDWDDPAPFAYMATVGGIHCQFPRSSGPTDIWIWALRQLNNPSSPGSADEWMASHAGQVEATAGECGADSFPALETWTFSGRSGQLLCFTSVTGDAIVYWTYQGRNILGKAVRDDRDMAALLEWWRTEARLAD